MYPVHGPTWITYEDPSAAGPYHLRFCRATSSRSESRAARAVLGEIMRGRVDRIRTEMLASYGVEADYRSLLVGDALQIDGLVDAPRAGEVLHRVLADLDELRAGADSLRGDFVRARRAALAAALADPSIPSATGWRLESAMATQSALTRESLAAAIASTPLAM
jgi:hypothetical protein